MSKNKKQKDLAAFVVSIRSSRDLSTRELGKLIGTSGPYISLIESGRYNLPTDFVAKLAPVLNKAEKEEVLAILYNQLKKDCGI